ncbi:TonB-dependent siderophore receptor [Symbiopectobacterium purcellii]|uniref:TonB-dependent siderophore receptor n=1 Tax=Symbiopectobacterium purcellii TaxID=2871826 RepID=A0ABX9AKW4_9ENTR|nr:TonB-dependent siderophore receptor [Symbiopectobacterium purcellii]
MHKKSIAVKDECVSENKRKFYLIARLFFGFITVLSVASSLLVAAQTLAAETVTGNADVMVVIAQGEQNTTLPAGGIIAKQSTAGTKTPTPLVKTPQSIAVVTRAQMDKQRVRSVSDALNYSAGVLPNYRGSSNRNDKTIVRGFRYAPKFLDGLSFGLIGQGAGIGKIDPWLLERVELIRGPASVMYGQVDPGGTIIMTSKRPTAEKIRHVQFSAGNQRFGEAAFDFGGVLNDDSSLLYRLNGIANTQQQFVNNTRQQRMAIAPALTWLPNADTSLTVLTRYQYDPEAGFRNFLPAYGTVFATNAGYIPYTLNVSDPNYHHSTREQTAFGYIFEHSFNSAISLQQNLRYSQLHDNYKSLVYSTGGSVADTTLIRNQQREKIDADELGIDTQLKANVVTHAVSHTLLAGLDYIWQKRNANFWLNSGSQYDFDWTHPHYGGAYLENDSDLHLVRSANKKLDQVGLYVQDQAIWRQWNLLLSGRHDWTEIRTYESTLNNAKRQSNYNDFTGRAALLYAFENGFSPYISYSTSFEPNLDSGIPGSEPFKPTTGEQTEVGIKFQPVGRDTLLTLSLFDITQKNITSWNSKLKFNEQIGRVESRGAEAEIHTQITPALSLMSAYSYTEAETKESINASIPAGNRPAATPRHMASAWGTYVVRDGPLAGLALGTGARYIGSSYGDNQESFSVPHYILYDAMVSYDLGSAASQWKGAVLQINVNNLTDKHYVASCSNSEACFYGAGRTIIATVSYRW